MEIRQVMFTKNPRYIEGKKITPKGIMVHSTGANNPKLRRYVQPDDGLLGVNSEGSDWNRASQPLCVHAFIGKDKNGDVRCYQVLPWNYRTYHCGTGTKGSGNSTHIAFEICEDGLDDPVYFGKIYETAVALCMHLCKEFNLTEKDVICHCEGHTLGIASNHSDVMHWFSKFGKTMDDFREDVKSGLNTSLNTNNTQEVKEEMTQKEFNGMMENYLKSLEEKKPSGWSEAARAWAESKMIISGDENGNMKYGTYPTREEIAQIIYNALGR